MGYDTATTESILLKYLQMHSDIRGANAANLADLVSDLSHAESKMRNLDIYGFAQTRDIATNQLLTDIADLQEFGFLIHDEATTGLALTEWGRLCAAVFDLPGPLALTFDQVIRAPRPHMEQSRMSQESHAACVTL